MPVWNHTLQLTDVFHDDEKPIEDKAKEIVRRIKAAPFWDEDDTELVEIVDELEDVDSEDYFDQVFSAFYDWADAERVWVATF